MPLGDAPSATHCGLDVLGKPHVQHLVQSGVGGLDLAPVKPLPPPRLEVRSRLVHRREIVVFPQERRRILQIWAGCQLDDDAFRCAWRQSEIKAEASADAESCAGGLQVVEFPVSSASGLDSARQLPMNLSRLIS